jgi:squalene-hopene/tetraprenyl-beta-curcumene cyclase
MGLCAFGDPDRPSLRRGIEHLIRTQNPDGSWSEEETTGTGFPKVFYLKYDMYRNAWPLLALATYRQLLERAGSRFSVVNGRFSEVPRSAPANPANIAGS